MTANASANVDVFMSPRSDWNFLGRRTKSFMGDTSRRDAFSHQSFNLLQSSPCSLFLYMVIFGSISMPARIGRGNVVLEWLIMRNLVEETRS